MLYTPHYVDITGAAERYLESEYEFVLEKTEEYSTCTIYRFWGTGIVSSSLYKTVHGKINRKSYDIGITNRKVNVYMYGGIERWIQETIESCTFDKTPMYLMRHRITGEYWLRDLSDRQRPDILLETL